MFGVETNLRERKQPGKNKKIKINNLRLLWNDYLTLKLKIFFSLV